MKIWALLILWTLTFAGIDPHLAKVRDMYKKAPGKESHCKGLLKLLETATPNQPLLYGYKGCATMIMAKHSFNPFNKLSFFKKGKNILETAINKDPENIELRYLRLAVQINTPSFLGYKDDIKNDKLFLNNNIKHVADHELLTMIQAIL